MTATNTLLDLVSSDPDARFWEQLREEAAGVFNMADDWTNPASLPRLPLADSTIRESLRENPMLTRVILREVMPKDGVMLPSGHHFPKGAWIGAGTVDLHHDDRFYPEPGKYDPFRFATKYDEKPAGVNRETLTGKASIYRKNQGLATVSDIFLAFGYGKHAWYVVNIVDGRPPLCWTSSDSRQSWSLACSSSAETDARLRHLELRYPVHGPASCKSSLWRQHHSFPYRYDDGSQEKAHLRDIIIATRRCQL